MHNTYIATLFPWNTPSRKIALANRLLRALGMRSRLVEPLDSWHDMTNQEQRINIYHLVSQVLRSGVPGAFVELGCFVGETAAMIQKINHDEGQPPRPLHLYDSFAVPFYLNRPVRDVLEENFRTRGLPLPVIHAGTFDETLPDALPDTIAFAHIDCGFGGDPESHAAMVRQCLGHVYPRLSTGAALVLMDYAIPERWPRAVDVNPGVRRAADAFFADRPEAVRLLYAGEGSQGVVFKASPRPGMSPGRDASQEASQEARQAEG